MGPASRARRCTVYPDGNVRVGERLEVDRVEFWDAKGDPEHDGDRDWGLELRTMGGVEQSLSGDKRSGGKGPRTDKTTLSHGEGRTSTNRGIPSIVNLIWDRVIAAKRADHL